MKQFHNLNGKRVCDISNDGKMIEIYQKGCLTRITVKPNGTLDIKNIPVPQTV